VCPLEIGPPNNNGDIPCYPIERRISNTNSQIFLDKTSLGGPKPKPGDYALAKISQVKDTLFSATIIRLIKNRINFFIGVIGYKSGKYFLTKVEKSQKFSILIQKKNLAGADIGDLVQVEVLPSRYHQNKFGRVIKKFEQTSSKKYLSSIAIHQYEIPFIFPKEAISRANSLKSDDFGVRKNFLNTPLVTIDGEDAKDFDDAVWAKEDCSPSNKGGWHLIIAIADVAWYVRQNDEIDLEAKKRGNSVYFPDTVVPMLPEKLSNDLCSLLPNKIRPCLAVDIWIDSRGNLIKKKFSRGIMKSAARLSYSQIQKAWNGKPDSTTQSLLKSVITPLYGAYDALTKARIKREPLEINLPENRVNLSKDGQILSIQKETRLDSHKLIEEFMIIANVAAAQVLTTKKGLCIYRNHSAPSYEKLEAFSQFLKAINFKFPKEPAYTPQTFNKILKQSHNTPHHYIVSQLTLRSQMQAEYSHHNHGHFGLGLKNYCHFTSPIRRYSDLIVHRSLINALNLGADKNIVDENDLQLLAAHISSTERRAVNAERSTMDRFSAKMMDTKLGDTFNAIINSVTRFGLFLALEDTGIEGLIPTRYLPRDYYKVDSSGCRLVGEKFGKTYSLGDALQVRLEDSDFLTGRIRFSILDSGARTPLRRGKPKTRKLLKKKLGKNKKKPNKD